jgi:hypothetical protein
VQKPATGAFFAGTVCAVTLPLVEMRFAEASCGIAIAAALTVI